MRSRAWMIAVAAAAAAHVSPMLEPVSAQSGTGIVISEFRFRGPNGANDEFVELFNAGSEPVNIGGWLVRASNNNVSPSVATRVTITANTIINPGCFYLIANTNAPAYSGGVAPNQTYTIGFGDEGGVGLTLPNTTTIIDQVGFGANGAFGEGQRLPAVFTDVDRGFERRPGGSAGHVDSNDNFADFREITPGNPQNASSPCITAVVRLPHDVQGAGAASPLTGTNVTVRGVVTARSSDGFFLQTEPGDEDADAATSEGLFVFTGGSVPPAAQVGHLVQVAAAVAESVPPADPSSPPRTQLASVVSVTDLGAASLPDPYGLTPLELSDSGALDQLERFEGMRVTVASLTAVSGTAADGAFFAVLSGQPRPFREPGVDAGSPVPACALAPCNVPVFDGNPERLRVDTDALEGATAVLLPAGAVMSNVTGPLDFASRAYTLLPDVPPSPSGGALPLEAPAAPPGQYSVATLDLDRFYDTTDDPASDDEVPPAGAYQARLAKASLAVRGALGLPDIVGVLEVENESVLQDVAARIDADEVAAGHAAPAYAALLVEHANQDGLDVALLVKSGRVTPLSLELAAGNDATAHPSLVLRAGVSGPSTSLPQALTVIVSQLPAADAPARQAQSQWLANYIQGRQINDPNEAIVAVGGYHAFNFNDGLVDVVGTVRGAPAPPDQVAYGTTDVVSPDLVNASGLLPVEQRYSFVFNGNAQALDHILVSASLAPQLAGFAHARINADFPEALAADPSTPFRLSDRDPLVAYFTFPPDVTAPVFAFAPDRVAEATGPDGAAVSFDSPAATDNLDPVVVVSCTPASGSVFPLGNSGVACQAQDAAGNVAATAFTVTVQDTTAPAITTPGDLTVEAQSPSGREVSFSVSATDAVTPSPAVACSPVSGSLFAIGVTTVLCTASDDTGNSATASFTVTVTPPVPGRMQGAGHVGAGSDQGVWFAFDVRESADYVERGWLRLLAKGDGRPDRYLAAGVTEVRFSNDLETVTFAGVGSWNGQPGYAFEVSASDRGEPGVDVDTFSLVVTAPDGTVVESATGVLRDGNILSHVR